MLSQKYCRTNGRRTAVQMGVVLQYKWEVCCWVSLSSRLRSQKGFVIQMRGVLPYKMGEATGCRRRIGPDPAPQKSYIHRTTLGELMRVKKSHWKSHFIVCNEGVGHHTENVYGNYVCHHYMKFMSRGPGHYIRIYAANHLYYNVGTGCTRMCPCRCSIHFI